MAETTPDDSVVLIRRAQQRDPAALAQLFERNTQRLLEVTGPKRMIVFGVALDICVNNAVRGLIKWGRTETIVLSDVVKGLGTQKDDDVYARFRERGVRIMTLSEVKEML